VVRWYRAYEGTVTDPKLGEAAMLAGCSRSVAVAAWHLMLEAAAVANDGGRFDCPAMRIAVALGEPLATTEAVLTAFGSIGMIRDDLIVAWADRQYESDRSAGRMRKCRAKKKGIQIPPVAERNAGDCDVTSHQSESDVTVTSHVTEVTAQSQRQRQKSSVANATGENSPRLDRAGSLRDDQTVPAPPPGSIPATPSATHAVPSALDMTKAIFDTGASILTAAGIAPRQARSIVGRWRQTYQDSTVLAVLARAQVLGPSEPVEWITAALRNERQQATGDRNGQEPSHPDGNGTGKRGSIVGNANRALARLEFADRH
jgi:hypothetical protein